MSGRKSWKFHLFQIKKLELVAKANIAQHEEYERVGQDIESQMEKANETIAQATWVSLFLSKFWKFSQENTFFSIDLEQAKKYKANQMEYDALAQIILKHKERL